MAGGKSGAKPETSPARPARGADSASETPLSMRIAVALFVALLVVGLAGYEASALLASAVARSQVNGSSAQLAAFVCQSLKTQDYTRLVAYIDPATITPSVTKPFDAQATIAQLRSHDASEGNVVECDLAIYPAGSLVTTDGNTRYQMTLRRTNDATPIAGTLLLRQVGGAKGGWLVERDSTFLAPPAA